MGGGPDPAIEVAMTKCNNDSWKSARPATHRFRFIQQFLSPRLIREFKLFALSDAAEDQHYTV